jgi:hypothetical protein
MVTEGLTLRVKDRKESDLGAEMLRVGGDGAQRLSRSPEQNVVDDLLVLKSNGNDGLRYGEDHMKIRGVEKLGLAVFHWARASNWHFVGRCCCRRGAGGRSDRHDTVRSRSWQRDVFSEGPALLERNLVGESNSCTPQFELHREWGKIRR